MAPIVASAEIDRPAAVGPGVTITAPRTTSRDIRRPKSSNYKPG